MSLQVISVAACKRKGRWLRAFHLLGSLLFLADGFLQKCLAALSMSICSPLKEGCGIGESMKKDISSLFFNTFILPVLPPVENPCPTMQVY